MSAQPWFKFYPSDWRADAALRMCSPSARCLWMEMLCIMHEASPRGHLVVNGNGLDVRKLAVQAGMTSDEVTSDLAELEANGVFSRKADGTIFSRKMVRETRTSEEQRGRAEKRWSLEKTEETKSGDAEKMPHKKDSQKPEAREDSETNVSAKLFEFEPAPQDPNKRAWSEAVVLLTTQGRMSTAKARAFFGRVLTDHRIEARALLGPIGEAVNLGTADPQSYLVGAAKSRERRKGEPAPEKRQTWI